MTDTKPSLFRSRTAFKPFDFEWAYNDFVTSESMHWLPTEITLNDDISTFKSKLNPAEISLITQIFRFFTQADCFPDGAEILTSEGYVDFRDLTTESKVAQVYENGDVEFVTPTQIIHKPFEGDLVEFSSDRKPLNFSVTPNHNIVYEYNGAFRREPASEVKLYQNKNIRVSGNGIGPVSSLTPMERIMIVHQADGHVKDYGTTGEKIGGFRHYFTFSKQRKIDRFRQIMTESGLEFAERPVIQASGPYVTFDVILPERLTKDFGWVDLSDKSAAWANEFIEELSHWDCHVADYGRIYFTNTNEAAANKVHAVCAIAGRDARLTRHQDNRSEKFSDTFKVSIGTKTHYDGQYVKKASKPYTGEVHCVSVPTRSIMVRVSGQSFVTGNCDVAGAYIDKYLPVFKPVEVRMAMTSIAAREAVHIQAYSMLIDQLGLPETEYSAFMEYEAMKTKHEYMQEERPGLEGMARDIAVFSAFGEGLQLFASFVMLLNFTRYGKMTGVGQIIAWSVRDETLHVEFMMKVFSQFMDEHPELWTDEFKRSIYETARDMVALEDKFIDLVYSNTEFTGGIEGLTADEVKQYIRYIADRRLLQLGLKPNYGVDKNPLPWVDVIVSGKEHVNFFENRATDYSKGATTGSWDDAFGADAFADSDNWDTSYTLEEQRENLIDIQGVTDPESFGLVDTFEDWEIITKPKGECPFCDRAKDLMDINGIPYRETVLETEEQKAAFRVRFAPKPTVPQIFRNGTRIGGHDDLRREFEARGLKLWR